MVGPTYFVNTLQSTYLQKYSGVFIRCYGIGKTLRSRNECIVTNWYKNRKVIETIRVYELSEVFYSFKIVSS